MGEIFDMILAFSSNYGYWGIVFLMAVESSFIPFPSEIIIPPAAYLAAQGEFNIGLVVLSGIAGSLIGAIINYALAKTLGRKIIYAIARKKISKFFLINEEKISKAELYFLKYGNISTLFGRLIPAVRQLVSIPAGFAKMKFSNFIFYTALGSGIWIALLAGLGYAFGANQEILARYYENIKYYIWGICLIFLLVIIVRAVSRRSKSNPK